MFVLVVSKCLMLVLVFYISINFGLILTFRLTLLMRSSYAGLISSFAFKHYTPILFKKKKNLKTPINYSVTTTVQHLASFSRCC